MSVHKGAAQSAQKLDEYLFVANGWFDNVQVYPIPSRTATFLVRARVPHSQRLSVTPLRPWVAVEKIGSVLCSHCNCMAGLGEACSHIAAVLFALEANMQERKSMSSTSLPCSWLPPSFQITFCSGDEVCVANPRVPVRHPGFWFIAAVHLARLFSSTGKW